MRASMHVKTRYFLDGGRARAPEVNVDAYFVEDDSRDFWIDEDIFGG